MSPATCASAISRDSGSTAHGEVTLVERGGRLKERARLGIRFTSVVLADGTWVPLETDTIYRERSGRGPRMAGRIGGAIIGGPGARRVGGSAGAGAGRAAGRRPQPATPLFGTPVTVRVTKPATVTVSNLPSAPAPPVRSTL